MEGRRLPPGVGFRKGLVYAEQAIRLDPDLAEGHAALAYTLLHNRWDIPAAERSFTHAIRLNPHYGPAHHWYSHLLVADGRLEESLSESLAYLKVDPVDQFSLVHMSWHYLMAHQFDKALAETRRIPSGGVQFWLAPRVSWMGAAERWSAGGSRGGDAERC